VSDVELTPGARAIVSRAREFARERVAPFASEWEMTRKFPVCAFREGARLGLAGVLLSEDLGGLGLSHAAAIQVYQELAAACLPFGFSLFVQQNVIAGIATYGGESAIARYVPDMLKGERIGAFCITEPEAGSDAAGIKTTARKTNDGWEIEGKKTWITNGTVADVFSIYAQTDPAAGSRGIACFLVDAVNEGIERDQPYSLMGGHVMAVNGINLNRCKVPDGALLLGPGAGFKGAMAGINRARTMIAAMCCGILGASLDASVRYVSTRRAFGQYLSEFQGLQFELAEVATDLEAAKMLAYRAAYLLDQGQRASVAAAHAKKFATKVAFRGISTCMRAMGANGYLTENPHARHLASAQMCQYLDGTDEIQNVIIGRALLEATR
jgi:alkylation response protein AidB-like acyl-CoA dehydrogenase